MIVDITLEENNALQEHYEQKREIGTIVEFQVYIDSNRVLDVFRGEVSLPKASDVFQIPAHPVIFNPTEKQLEKYGIQDKVNILVSTPYYAWRIKGVNSPEELDQDRSHVRLFDRQYQVNSLKPEKHFGRVYLNWVFGLVDGQ